MKIKCYNSKMDGTWIIDTVREYRRSKASDTEYENIDKYNDSVLEDVKKRKKTGMISRFDVIEG